MALRQFASLSKPQQEPLGFLPCFEEAGRESAHLRVWLYGNGPTFEEVVRAYRLFGPQGVRTLEGDFSLCLWDGESSTLLLAVDSMGYCPLVYSFQSDGLYVSFSLESLLSHLKFVEKDLKGIACLLGLRPQDHESGYYRGVHYLPPACFAVWRSGEERLSFCRYWNPPVGGVEYRDSEQEAEEFWYLILAAVQCRLPPEGRIGLALSGGLDSGALVAALSQLGVGFTAYSSVFERFSDCDEAGYVEALQEHFGFPLVAVPGDFSFHLESALEFAAAQIRPRINFYWPLVASRMSRAREDGVTHLFNGQFGDFLYINSRFWLADAILSRKVPGGVNWSETGSFAHLKLQFTSLLARFLPGSSRPLASRPSGMTSEFFSAWIERFSGEGSLHQRRCVLSLYSASFLKDTLEVPELRRIEPFRDRRLVEFVLRTPGYRLGYPGESKAILRRALRASAPRRWVERRGKTSFESLVMGELEQKVPVMKGLLRRGVLWEGGVLDGAWVDSTNDHVMLWVWSCLERFYAV